MAKKKAVKKKKSAKKKVKKSKPQVYLRSDEELKRAEQYLGAASKTLPLSQSFFVTSILGFIISAGLMLYGTISATWGFAFCLVFVMMLIASFVTIHPKEEYHN